MVVQTAGTVGVTSSTVPLSMAQGIFTGQPTEEVSTVTMLVEYFSQPVAHQPADCGIRVTIITMGIRSDISLGK